MSNLNARIGAEFLPLKREYLNIVPPELLPSGKNYSAQLAIWKSLNYNKRSKTPRNRRRPGPSPLRKVTKRNNYPRFNRALRLASAPPASAPSPANAWLARPSSPAPGAARLAPLPVLINRPLTPRMAPTTPGNPSAPH